MANIILEIRFDIDKIQKEIMDIRLNNLSLKAEQLERKIKELLKIKDCIEIK